MKRVSCALLKYTPDQALGESLNVGVVGYCPETNEVAVKVAPSLRRITKAFADVDLTPIRQDLRYIRHRATLINGDLQNPLAEHTRTSDRVDSIESLLGELIPDNGLSIYADGPRDIRTRKTLAEEMAGCFERMVDRYWPRESERPRITSDDVFVKFHDALAKKRDVPIHPYVFESKTGFIEHVEHAFRGNAWNVIEPMTLDYLTSQEVEERLQRLCGRTYRIKQAKDISRLVVLYALPQSDTLAFRAEKEMRAYRSAFRDVDLFEHNDSEKAAEFVRQVASA